MKEAARIITLLRNRINYKDNKRALNRPSPKHKNPVGGEREEDVVITNTKKWTLGTTANASGGKNKVRG